ncbi:hypothetical protein B5S31_g2340 [[Candida] boidinii]|nr:hypothetical protein B5S31_g2340 [[Candida] boidinii]
MEALNVTESYCKSYWKVDDFTNCSRHLVLETIFPELIFSISFIILLATIIANFKNGSPIQLKPNLENEPLLDSNRTINTLNYDATQQSINNPNTTNLSPGKAIALKHFDISQMSNVKDDGTQLGVTKIITRSFNEKMKVILEEIFVLIQLSISISVFFLPKLLKEWKNSTYIPYINVIFWAYLFIISTARTLNMSTNLLNRLPNMWGHSFALYTVKFLTSMFLFRASLLNHVSSSYAAKFHSIQFIITTILFLNSLFAQSTDKPALVYYQDKLEASPEPIISFFDWITYSWLNKMIWDSHKDPITMDRIWSLARDDYAYVVLTRFHNTVSKLRFTWKLFAQFSNYFLLQSVLAVCESFLVFLPSILLKKILEFIDDPTTIPISAAWLYVIVTLIGSFICSCFSNLSLFIGRRLCARIKAIIIGEVYAKALRRRAVISSESDDEKKDKEVNAAETSASSSKDNKDSKDGSDDKKSKDLGSIINLMAVDSFKVSEICGYLHFFVSSIIMTIVAITLLYQLLGAAALAGSLSLIVMLPVNYKLSSKLGKLQESMLSVTDKRVQKLNETLQSIRIIKFFAWEEKFYDQIDQIRENELTCLLNRCYVWILSSFVWFFTPTAVSFFAFYYYVYIDGNVLTTPIAFTALSLFNLLRAPLDQFADMLSFVIQSKVSLDRVEEFLDEEDSTKYEQLYHPKSPNAPLIGFRDASFTWNKDAESEFKLKNINIDFKVSKLNIIVGATGSGKTSLLLALLGEMDKLSGEVYLNGITPRDELVPNPATGLTESVAYCAQSAWLLNDTIRENILFASPYNEDRYKAVIHACGLERDLEILDNGDETEVGEKGITLSGGQKQRVSLARALYSTASYILLDDCLSAVDSHTATHIYEHCITGPLMNSRTCILVSHNVALTIQQAEYVVLMENGRVKSQGSVEMMIQGGFLGEDSALKSVLQSRSASSVDLVGMNSKNVSKQDYAAGNDLLAKTAAALGAEAQMDMELDDNIERVEVAKDGKPKSRLVEEETKSNGFVSFEIYKIYFRCIGGFKVLTLFIFVLLLAEAVRVLLSWWLKVWSMDNEQIAQSGVFSILSSNGNAINYRAVIGGLSFSSIFSASEWNKPIITYLSYETTKTHHSTLFYISWYAVIGMIYAIVASLRVIVSFVAGVHASRKIFRELLSKVLRAKLRFFDSTPVGRIMNRFSRDIEGIDQELAPYGDAFFVIVLSALTTIGLISVITPGFLILAVFICLSFYTIGYFYMELTRELKRFDSITRSPIHQHFTETLVGVTTIRAYGDERRFLKHNLARIDENNRPFFYLWVANRWLAFRTEIVSSFITFFASSFAVAGHEYLNAGLAGMSLSFAITFIQNAVWLVRTYAMLEMNMNSIERIQEYMSIDQEPDAFIPDNDPPQSWPENGSIEVSDLSLRYAPALPRVINNVSFNVQPCTKIGIVGRTGAGKSTIITAFFRFIDPETGSIKIDGYDITKIGLTRLRRGITIIPQDPTLFSGTIRSNLDPFDEYSDEEIYRSLKRVSLLTEEEYETLKKNGFEYVVEETGSTDENKNNFLELGHPMAEGGSNISQGQRQLVCLARSLLKSPKIIMLDEATASIDYKSDALIQRTIREEFANSTIMTIAHRLRSIIDYDKILVLDGGRVKEFADPYTLITDKSSQFRSMCEDSGEFDELVNLAKESQLKNKKK